MNTKEESIITYSRRAIRLYGEHVLEDRAVPDFRDGLKPVQRRILYAMHTMGLHGHKKAVSKSARTVGEVLGRYHCHGDSAAYDAMVTLVSGMTVPLLKGEGNWGDMLHGAASMRYTEGCLSLYSDSCFFDRHLLPAMTLVPNFDQSTTEPLVLPAKLPNILLNGAFGIAVGGIAHIPPFHHKGVVHLVKRSLLGKPITVDSCMSHLKISYRYGGDYFTGSTYDEELRRFFETGSGTVHFFSPHLWDAKRRAMRFNSFAPNLVTKNKDQPVLRPLEKIVLYDFVQEVNDCTSIENGICYDIVLQKGTEEELTNWRKTIAAHFESKLTYKVNITTRYFNEDSAETRATFKSSTIPEIITSWVQWRVETEKQALTHWLAEVDTEIQTQTLLAHAIANIKIVLHALQQDDCHGYLVKNLNITVAQAKELTARSILSLHRMNLANIKAEIGKLNEKREILLTHLKNPAAKVIKDIESTPVL